MERRGDEIHIDSDDARGGSTPHIVRYVLGISLALAVIAMTAVWLIPALSNDASVTESDRVADPAEAGAAETSE